MAEIVVGVDGSEPAGRALRWAAREAQLRHAALVAVLAWGFVDQHDTVVADRLAAAYGERQARQALDRHIAGAFGGAGGEAIVRRLVCDLPARALLGAADRASLLVVGSRGRGGFRSLLLGSVSEQCLHHATCPVAVVRVDPSDREVGERAERIVVGVDGSEFARRALRWAITEATLRGASLEVVHAWPAPVTGAHPYATEPFEPGLLAKAGQLLLDDVVAAEDVTGLAAPPERILLPGGAAPALLDVAKGADLVVVGSRGRGGFSGLLLGSVSHQVARHAPCPVVIVPPEV